MTEPKTTAQRLSKFLGEIDDEAFYSSAIADAILADRDIVAAIAAHRAPGPATVEQQLAALRLVAEAAAEHFTYSRRAEIVLELDQLHACITEQADDDRAIGEQFAHIAGVTPPNPTHLGAFIRAAVTATGATITPATKAAATEEK